MLETYAREQLGRKEHKILIILIWGNADRV